MGRLKEWGKAAMLAAGLGGALKTGMMIESRRHQADETQKVLKPDGGAQPPVVFKDSPDASRRAEEAQKADAAAADKVREKIEQMPDAGGEEEDEAESDKDTDDTSSADEDTEETTADDSDEEDTNEDDAADEEEEAETPNPEAVKAEKPAAKPAKAERAANALLSAEEQQKLMTRLTENLTETNDDGSVVRSVELGGYSDPTQPTLIYHRADKEDVVLSIKRIAGGSGGYTVNNGSASISLFKIEAVSFALLDKIVK